MKTALTIEQSAELIRKGISIDYASGWKNDPSFDSGGGYVFTLTDLLSLLPETIEVDFPNFYGSINIEDCYLCMQKCINDNYTDNRQWCVFYTNGFQTLGDLCAKDLIDALYKCLIWAIDNNYVKFD